MPQGGTNTATTRSVESERLCRNAGIQIFMRRHLQKEDFGRESDSSWQLSTVYESKAANDDHFHLICGLLPERSVLTVKEL